MAGRVSLTLALVVLLLAAGCGSPQPGSPTGATPSDPTTTLSVTPTETQSGEGTGPAETTVTDATGTSTPGLNDGTNTRATPTPGVDTTSTTAPSNGQQSTWTVEIVRIIDGDTMEVRFDDGHTEDVRLLGVDTPEVHTENDPAEFEGIPENEEGRQWLRDWGHKASEFARAELEGETVTIETDDEADRRGSYGRLLVYLKHDGGVFNRQLLRQGYARLYESQFSDREMYEELEADAQAGDIGLWNFERSSATATPVPDGGSSQGLAIAEIHADASGSDHENLNGEYITFENTGQEAIDMGGWTVEDEANHAYTVPDGFTLAAGDQVTLYTGSGDDTQSSLYWGSESAVWNNDGDTIYVRDDSGTVVLERTYS